MRKGKRGFTLAEILVTLGVIGVIASMTVPTLVQDIQDAQFKAAAKKAYAELSGVVRRMVQEKGSLNSYFDVNAAIKSDFMGYFNVIQDCGITNCVSASTASNMYKSLAGDLGDTNMPGGEGQFVTNSGMFINIQNNISTYGVIVFVVDVNSYKKGPNIFGKDTFAFQVVNDVLMPIGATGTLYAAENYCNKSYTSSRQGLGCAAYVMKDVSY